MRHAVRFWAVAARNIAAPDLRGRKALRHASIRGHLAPIETIGVGDAVWSWDAGRQRAVRQVVMQVFERRDEPVLTVVCVDATGKRHTIESTTDHPFWTEARGWSAARTLRARDRLRSIDGTWLRVERAPTIGRRAAVHNIEVRGTHNYFVAAAGVLVHNHSKPAWIPVDSTDMPRWDREDLRHPGPLPADLPNIRALSALGLEQLDLLPQTHHWYGGQGFQALLPAGGKWLPSVLQARHLKALAAGGMKDVYEIDGRPDLVALMNKPEWPAAVVLSEIAANRTFARVAKAPTLPVVSVHAANLGEKPQIAFTTVHLGDQVLALKPKTLANHAQRAGFDLASLLPPSLRRVSGMRAELALREASQGDPLPLVNAVFKHRAAINDSLQARGYPRIDKASAGPLVEGLWNAHRQGIAGVDTQAFAWNGVYHLGDIAAVLSRNGPDLLAIHGRDTQLDLIPMAFEPTDRLYNVTFAWQLDALTMSARAAVRDNIR